MAKLGFGARLASFFGFRKQLDESFFEDLEDVLIEGDFGAKNAYEISSMVESEKPRTEEEFLSLVRRALEGR